MAELHELTAVEQAQAVRDRMVSPVELVEHYLARIEAIDGVLGAFVTVTADAALDAARAAEKLVTEASDASGLPPLLGVPTAIKDLNLTAGVRTTFGSPVFAKYVPEVSDAVTWRSRRPGWSASARPRPPSSALPATPSPRGGPRR